VNRKFVRFYWSPRFRYLRFKRRYRRSFRGKHGYHPPTRLAYDLFVPFRVRHEAPTFRWARRLEEPLYHRRGSLTVAINLLAILHPGRDVKLLGIDLSDPRYFYDDEITPGNRETLVHDSYFRGIEAGRHVNALPSPKYPDTLLDSVASARSQLRRDGVELWCCNPRSLLVEKGVCEFRPVLAG
jgi:hypothetical protein